MRTILVGALLLGSGCNAFPVLAEPRIVASPYLSQYRLRGDIAMQSAGPVDNQAQALRAFGYGHPEDDVGVRFDVGDGFAGARLDYLRLSAGTTRTGVLDDDFGALLAGDTTQMRAAMDEWRLSWSESVLTEQIAIDRQPLEVRMALGAVWAHRSLSMHMQTTDGLRRQQVHHDGSAFYPSVHLRTGVKNLALDVEYAIAPDLVTGDFDGLQQDLEARIRYTIPFQDVTLFAGYRWSTLQATGSEGGLAFDSDLTLSGVQLGMAVSF